MDTTINERLRKVASGSTLQLTHIGRKSGKAHQVTIWFVVEGEKVFLPTANVDRNWVRNVRKTPHVEFSIDSEKFAGEARFLDNAADRERVGALVRRKYWFAAPLIAATQFFAALGLGTYNHGAFEVTLSG